LNGPTSVFLLASSLKQPSLFGYKIHKKKSLFGYKQVSSKHKLYWNQIPTIQIQSHKQHLHADGAPLLRAQQLLYRSVSHNPWNTSRAASACTIAKSTAVNRVEIQIITHTRTRAHTHVYSAKGNRMANSAFQIAALLVSQARFHCLANREEDPGFSASVDEPC
jgi:hypothetical protein